MLQVQKDKDKTIELEFNRLLDSVSHLAHQLHVDQVHRKPLSLGKSLEALIRCANGVCIMSNVGNFELIQTITAKLKINCGVN